MVNEELVEQVRVRYQQGERRADIKYDLMDEGWDETQIDAAISYIQNEAMRQIPGIGHIYKVIDNLDSKTAHSSPKVIAAVLAGCFALLLVISTGLFYILDPLGIKTLERDKQRETDIVKLRTAIDAFYTAKKSYPPALQGLVPDHLQAIPLDPRTGASYSYRTIGKNESYELCVVFEVQPSQCLTPSANNASAPPVVIATPTPDTGGMGSFDPLSTASESSEVVPTETPGDIAPEDL